MTVLQKNQAVSLVLALAGSAFYIIWALRHPRYSGYAVAPVSWLLHGAIFYACVFLRDFGGFFSGWDFTFWSSVVRLQGYALAAGIGAAMMLEFFTIARNHKGSYGS